MKERIDIIVEDKELERNKEKKERLEKVRKFEPSDRIPVIINTNQWTALAGRKRTFADYIRSPKDNLREQILNYKWSVENIHDDKPINTDTLTIRPDLGCIRGTEFPMEIIWQHNQPPKTIHLLTEPEQIDDLTIPDPWDGLNGKIIEWYKAMTELVDDFDIRLNGKPLRIQVELSHPGGPIPSAFALAGANLFLWMAMDPDRVHKLMDLVTESFIQCIAYFDELQGKNPNHPQGLGADTAEMISPGMFKEFVVPYYLRIWETYKGYRSLHNCGNIDHLLDIIRDDLKIDCLNGFGFPVDPDLLGQNMGGKVLLIGGPDPNLIKNGPKEDIISICMYYIEKVGSKGGYILSNGGGAVVDTPYEHYHAMVEASKRAAMI